jgi:hypothetical protein
MANRKNVITRCNGSGKIAISQTGRATCPDCYEPCALITPEGAALAFMVGITIGQFPIHNR